MFWVMADWNYSDSWSSDICSLCSLDFLSTSFQTIWLCPRLPSRLYLTGLQVLVSAALLLRPTLCSLLLLSHPLTTADHICGGHRIQLLTKILCVIFFKSNHRQLQRLYLAGLMREHFPFHTRLYTTDALKSLKGIFIKDSSLSSQPGSHIFAFLVQALFS